VYAKLISMFIKLRFGYKDVLEFIGVWWRIWC